MNDTLRYHPATAHLIVTSVICLNFFCHPGDDLFDALEKNVAVVGRFRWASFCLDDSVEYHADDGYADDVDAYVYGGLLFDDVSFPYSS